MKRILAFLFGLPFAGAVLAQSPELPLPNGQPQALQAYLTGYSFWDNTPPGTVEISHPVRHRFAGGMGTFSNPITLAVGHRIISGEDILDFPAGTLFYLPRLRKYAMVEDTCGDGPSPQDGPCHTGKKSLIWLDIYVDGVSVDKAESEACMNKITGVQPVVMDPGPNMSVVVGPITEGGCFVFPNP
ncbi:MAG: hypothetical protein COB08_015440 [Rhodobacteraceae bacterium]|nr:hypothetical protein [Paracoccaceae bacterium]